MNEIEEKIQELYDKELIQQVRFKCAEALDSKNWELFKSLFTDTINTDFTEWGIPIQIIDKENFVSNFFQKNLSNPDLKTQHLFSNFRISINQNGATSVCNFVGNNFIENFIDGNEYCLHGEYTDTLTKTSNGWKIDELKFKLYYQTGNQKLLQ